MNNTPSLKALTMEELNEVWDKLSIYLCEDCL